MAEMTVSEWVQQTEKRMLAVQRESTQRLVTLMQSRIPVDTGFARASVRASLKEMPKIDPKGVKPPRETRFPYDPVSVAVVIARAQLGQTVYVGWTANYVESLELGHSRQAPSGFIRVSALEWPRIVAEVSVEARQRVGT